MFVHYPPQVTEVLAVEPEPRLRATAHTAARSAPVPIRVVDGLANTLPARDGEFDAAVTALVLCTVPDQGAALAEIHRVLRPGGRLLFLEHVLAEQPGTLRRAQKIADATLWPLLLGGCRTSRDTLAAITAAGAGLFALQRRERPATSAVSPTCPTGQASPSATPVAVLPVSHWEKRYMETSAFERTEALPASRTADSWKHYDLSYAVDANTAMFRATGVTRYLDRALEYITGVVPTARPSKQLAPANTAMTTLAGCRTGRTCNRPAWRCRSTRASRPGFDGDIETWEMIQRCPPRRSTPTICVSVRLGWRSRPAGIRRPRSEPSGGSPTSAAFIRRRCAAG
ncbi:class I SAM-dependent methyltransferase [Actinoplanes utahensis]|uniref:class I SAM-dependent methyltransferase n=1 Tax=Actinoplanes utahensis TaxID=1869 RepID=UPI00361BF86F